MKRHTLSILCLKTAQYSTGDKRQYQTTRIRIELKYYPKTFLLPSILRIETEQLASVSSLSMQTYHKVASVTPDGPDHQSERCVTMELSFSVSLDDSSRLAEELHERILLPLVFPLILPLNEDWHLSNIQNELMPVD